jgi:Fe-S cluster biogenesis protein NfuA
MRDDLRERVQRCLTEDIGPALAVEGAALEVLDITDGVVRLRLNGACAACPATIMTMVMGLEQELRKLFPEIEYLEAVP